MPEPADSSRGARPAVERRRSIRRARLQRAPDAVAGAPLRPALQDRSGADDRAFGPVGLDHHEPAQRRGPVEARGAVARPRRPTDGAGLHRPRRRVRLRPEDRPAVERSRAGRFRRRRSAIAPARAIRYPTPEDVLAFAARALPRSDRPARRSASARGSPGSASRCRFSCGAGRRKSAPRPARWTAGARSTSARRSAGCAACTITVCNDATSACAAEFYFGEAWRERDFLYFFLGEFLGGGLVLNSSLYLGRTGNAAAVGSMPAPGAATASRSSSISPRSISWSAARSRRRSTLRRSG